MKSTFDVAVAGLGVHGSAAARTLALRGLRVLGVDARRPPHTHGSSHGRTRIIREAYFEDPLYVPLVQRSLDLWRLLEQASRRTLLRETGAIAIGHPHGTLVRGALASCQTHALPHEQLDSRAIRARFPALAVRPDDVAVYETRASALFAEECVEAQLHDARAAGATILMEEAVAEWRADRGGVRLISARGTYHAGALVLALGAWLVDHLDGAHLPLTIERQTQHWYAAPPALRAEHFPIVLWEYEQDRVFYAIPDVGHGLKAALHHEGALAASPSGIARAVETADGHRLRTLLDRFVPDAGAELDHCVCLYTNTPDYGFVVDVHPAHENVVIMSACSGHGFKFAPVLAETVADLATGSPPSAEIAPFRLGRFDADRASATPVQP